MPQNENATCIRLIVVLGCLENEWVSFKKECRANGTRRLIAEKMQLACQLAIGSKVGRQGALGGAPEIEVVPGNRLRVAAGILFPKHKALRALPQILSDSPRRAGCRAKVVNATLLQIISLSPVSRATVGRSPYSPKIGEFKKASK